MYRILTSSSLPSQAGQRCPQKRLNLFVHRSNRLLWLQSRRVQKIPACHCKSVLQWFFLLNFCTFISKNDFSAVSWKHKMAIKNGDSGIRFYKPVHTKMYDSSKRTNNLVHLGRISKWRMQASPCQFVAMTCKHLASCMVVLSFHCGRGMYTIWMILWTGLFRAVYTLGQVRLPED